MPVEVSPIAHYHMGGIQVDTNMRSSLDGLYAAGEAVGGANGANRLSGNAITEALVFGEVAGRNAAVYSLATTPSWPEQTAKSLLSDLLSLSTKHRDDQTPDQMYESLKALMWESVGPLRDADSMRGALNAIQLLKPTTENVSRKHLEPYDMAFASLCEFRAAVTVAEAVTLGALHRSESRGAHQRRDYPEMDNHQWRCSQVIKKHGDNLNLSSIARP